jgi:putative salt-induced outer membrane protein YdiY
MRAKGLIVAATAAVCLVAPASHAWAQQLPPAPPGPPKGLSGSAGFGLSLTEGNSETLNINATVDSIYDPKTNNVMKWNALFLRGKQNGVLAVNRVSAMFRDENTISGRMFVFGEMDVLHDTFKQIDYLLSPNAGLGYKILNSMRTQWEADAGAGAVVEQDAGVVARGAIALTLSEKLIHQLTPTTTIRETATALLKTNQWNDGLYTFQAGIAAKISTRFQLALDVLDSYKNAPIDPALKKNDLALVTSIVAKY